MSITEEFFWADTQPPIKFDRPEKAQNDPKMIREKKISKWKKTQKKENKQNAQTHFCILCIMVQFTDTFGTNISKSDMFK